jgi:hypothetical protein
MSTRKCALLVGCNYSKDPVNRLQGCINDVVNMSQTLVDAFDYDLNNIFILRDDSSVATSMPTRANIIAALTALIAKSANLDEIWFHYSGHGSQVKDTNGDELDIRDEVIVPTDFRTAGLVLDDDIFAIIQRSKCKTVLLFDSCHSGSICDMQWSYEVTGQTGKWIRTSNKAITSNPNIFCFSGCKDTQTSADAYDPFQVQSVGAFTCAFLYALRLNHMNVDIYKLYADVCTVLKNAGFSQIPVFSSSSPNSTYTFLRTSYRGVVRLNGGGAVLSTPIQMNASTKSSNTIVPRVSMKMVFF